jgi:hypothetical protein
VDALVPQDDAQPVGVVEDARAAEHIGEGVDLGGLTPQETWASRGRHLFSKSSRFPKEGTGLFRPSAT